MESKDRRHEDATVAELLSMMRSMAQDFRSQAVLLIELKKDVENILAAFPAGGLMEHRLDHERRSADRKDSHDFQENLKRGLALWGIGPVLLFGAYAVWEYIKIKARE